MKKIFYTALVSVLLISCGGESKEEKNTDKKEKNQEKVKTDETKVKTPFLTEEGKFEALFDGEPGRNAEKIPDQDIEVVSYYYEIGKTALQIISFTDFDAEMVKMTPALDVLRGAKQGVLSNFGITTFEVEENRKFDGHEGVYFKGNNGKYYVEYLFILVENRMYQIGVMGDGAYVSEEDAANFFNSFKLL